MILRKFLTCNLYVSNHVSNYRYEVLCDGYTCEYEDLSFSLEEDDKEYENENMFLPLKQEPIQEDDDFIKEMDFLVLSDQ